MTQPVRFSYSADRTPFPLLPLRLTREHRTVQASGLLDTGSAVNVLPWSVGQSLGLIWEQQLVPVILTGNLARFPARGVVLLGCVEPFPEVELAFAWTQSPDIPPILGQVNFFQEFDVCFFRSQLAFDVRPKSGDTTTSGE